MTVTVYLDQFFLVNFVMDCLLLLLVRKLAGIEGSKRRIALGAAAGSGIAALGLVLGLIAGCLWLWRGASLIAGAAVMIRAAYGPLPRREFLKAAVSLCITAVLMSGAIYGLQSFFRLGSLVFLGAGAFFAVRAAIGFLVQNRWERQRIYQVRLRYKGRECRIKALLDTGNQLYEPISRRPVHVLDSAAGRRLVTAVPAVMYIPYRSVGQPEGLLPAIYLDEMEAEKDGCLFRIKKPLVALSSCPLSPKNEYQMLLHGRFPEEGECRANYDNKEENL